MEDARFRPIRLRPAGRIRIGRSRNWPKLNSNVIDFRAVVLETFRSEFPSLEKKVDFGTDFSLIFFFFSCLVGRPTETLKVGVGGWGLGLRVKGLGFRASARKKKRKKQKEKKKNEKSVPKLTFREGGGFRSKGRFYPCCGSAVWCVVV